MNAVRRREEDGREKTRGGDVGMGRGVGGGGGNGEENGSE